MEWAGRRKHTRAGSGARFMGKGNMTRHDMGLRDHGDLEKMVSSRVLGGLSTPMTIPATYTLYDQLYMPTFAKPERERRHTQMRTALGCGPTARMTRGTWSRWSRTARSPHRTLCKPKLRRETVRVHARRGLYFTLQGAYSVGHSLLPRDSAEIVRRPDCQPRRGTSLQERSLETRQGNTSKLDFSSFAYS